MTISHSVAGGDYAANRTTAASVRITAQHNDGRRIIASTRDVSVNDGGTATCCTMKPNTEPGATVTLTSTVNGASDVTVSPSSVSFPTTDRSTEKTFTVGAATDADVADALASISYRVRGSDYEPGNVTAPDIAVSVTDAGDEVTGVALTASHPEIREGSPRDVTVTATLVGGTTGEDIQVTVTSARVTAKSEDFTDTPSGVQHQHRCRTNVNNTQGVRARSR